MPCPFFEPQSVAQSSTYENARLPLIDEYEGNCRLDPEIRAVGSAVRLLGCNHGNLSGVCADLNRLYENPANRKPILRFSVQARQSGRLRVSVIEEQDFTPLRWRVFAFQPGEQSFEPELNDACQRAQLLAFCRSYLARFPL